MQEFALQPGDRLLFVTDGMLERNAAKVDVERLMKAGAGLHARDAVQTLIKAVLRACEGNLRDDAAAMCLDWH